MPKYLRGNHSDQNQIRYSSDQNSTYCDNVNSPVNIHTTDKTEIVHLGKSSQNECSLFIQTGKKAHKALWDSGACKCVLSLASYEMIPEKYKTELFASSIKIKEANGTLIKNNGECDITFRKGTEKFTFPFLCSDQLSQQVIILAITSVLLSILELFGLPQTYCPSHM